MMATTELQAPYTDVETVEGESNGSVLEMREADSRSKLQNENLMSNSRVSTHKSKFSDINWLRGVEIIVLSGILLVVWALFAIPMLIFALNNKKAGNECHLLDYNN
jgi:hypothetical protein